MDMLLINLRVAGSLLIVLSLSHVPLAKHFRWREESALLSSFNRQVFLVHAFFVGMTVGLMGLLALSWAPALITPNPLGVPVTAGLAIFWAVRLFCQWFIYDRALWRGKPFETAVHIVFSLCWSYLTALFALCLRLQLAAG